MNLFKHLPSILSTSSRCYLRSPVLTSSRCYVRSPLLTAVPRCFSTVSLPPDIEFEELKKKLETKEVTLIDCRIPRELYKVGMIPDSKNILVQTIGPDILLPDDKFEEQFGFKKPGLDEPIVITCLAGIRARTAQLVMMAVGYKDVRVYYGSFEDWLEKGGPVVFPEPKSK